MNNKSLMIVALLFSILMTSCIQKDLNDWSVETEPSISEWVEDHPELSEFDKVLEKSGLKGTLNTYGNFTVFAPSNDAFQKFYEQHGALDNLSEEMLYNVVAYHLLTSRRNMQDISEGGFINRRTYHGQRISVILRDADVLLNGRAKIGEADVPLSNATAFVIDEVLTVPDFSVYDELMGKGNYSLFTEALEYNPKLKSMMMAVETDTISGIAPFLVKQDSIKPFTVLAVSDQVFSANNIMSVEDLADYARGQYAALDSLRDSIDFTREEALERYIGYHVLKQDTDNPSGYLFSSEILDLMLTTFSGDHDFVVGNDDFVAKRTTLNYVEGVSEGVDLNAAMSNRFCANGLVHDLQGMLPVISQEQMTNAGKKLEITRYFSDGFYFDRDEETAEFVWGFYEFAGFDFDGIVRDYGNYKIDDTYPVAFRNEHNTPAWVEYEIDGIIPGATYDIEFSGVAQAAADVFVYLYPEAEKAQFEADPYAYRVFYEIGGESFTVHAERGRFSYKNSSGITKDIPSKNVPALQRVLDDSTYKIRFEIRGKNLFVPYKLTLKQKL